MVIYPIIQAIIPGLPKVLFLNGKYEGVIAHSTAVYGDTDEGERSYESRNWKDAYVHFFIDYDSITQVADTNFRCWGAGAKANPKYLSVELCQVKNDGTKSALQKFNASYDRYVWLLAKLLYDRKLGVIDEKTLWSHNSVSEHLGGTNHTDPIAYLAEWGITWTDFVKTVKGKYDIMATPVVPAKPDIPFILLPSCIINGKRITGILSAGKLLVPLRQVADTLGKTITWDEKTQTATIK